MRVTAVTLDKLCARFPAQFGTVIWANSASLNVWGGGDYIIGANQAGKMHLVCSTVSP